MIGSTQLSPLEMLEIRPPCFADDRGFFSETWNAAAFEKIGVGVSFVQDNHAHSRLRGTLRGLHYQLPPMSQDKLVRVVRGAIFAVAVDVRRSSAAFGRWQALEVSEKAWNQMFVPRGFAFGYLTLEDETDVIYKVTQWYSPTHECGVRFDDPAIGIAWPIATELTISDRDRRAPLLAAAEVFA
jgi:dTDP-4-dehydrorhamnose 3,5-epimerase